MIIHIPPVSMIKQAIKGISNSEVDIISCHVTLDINTSLTYKGLVINYGEGGGLQNGKIAGPKLLASPLKTG